MEKIGDTSLFASANLIAYYELDTGALTTDSKGSNTLTNNNTVGEGTALFGTACADLSATNTNKSLSIATGLGVDMSGAFSVSGWWNIQTAPTNGQLRSLVDWRSTTGTSRYAFLYYDNSGGTIRLLCDVSGNFAIENVDLGTTDWHHIVETCSAAGAYKLYIDNVEVATATRGTGTSTNEMYMGISSDASSHPLSAFFDDVGFLDIELSTAQISEIFNPVAPSGTTSHHSFFM